MENEVLYNEILLNEKRKIEEQVKIDVYNILMKEINEKPTIYSISVTNYLQLFKNKGIDDENALYLIKRLHQDMDMYKQRIQQQSIRKMVEHLKTLQYVMLSDIS